LVRNSSIQFSAFIAFLILTSSAAGKTPNHRPFKAHTHFLATSTFIRGTWGTNKDVYLAEIATRAKNEFRLVKLIDEYPNLEPRLSVGSLTSADETVLRIRRDHQCDAPYGRMQLRAAPGEPMAILTERLDYQPKLLRMPDLNMILPCYRTVRP
jgi:hypothetical protein